MKPFCIAAALTLLLAPALLVGLQNYAEFRSERAIQAAEHKTYMSTVNGVDVGSGTAHTRITANHPDFNGPQVWLDKTTSRKTCATLTMTAYHSDPDHFIHVDCLDPDTDEPIAGLTRARIWR